MDLSMEYEWAVIVFGEKNKGKITYELMRSFSDVFRKESSINGLNLVQNPSFLFTKNVDIACSEVEEWLNDLCPDGRTMLIILFNDSDQDGVDKEMGAVLGRRVVIYEQDSESLLHCAHDTTHTLLRNWIKGICELLGEGDYYVKREDQSIFMGERLQADVDYNKIFDKKEIVADIDISVGERKERVVGEYNSFVNGLLDYVHVKAALEDLKLSPQPVKDMDLIKYIDGPLLHNRLHSPFNDREQNGQLLSLLVAATSTELSDLQSTVLHFLERIFKSGFIHYVLAENTRYVFNVASDEFDSNIFTYIQNILHLCSLARINHVPVCNTMYEALGFLMEIIPEKCWSTLTQDLRFNIMKTFNEFSVKSCSAEVYRGQQVKEDNLEEVKNEAELHVDPKSNTCIENSVLSDYQPAWINCEDAEPPEDFRLLPVYITSKDILHPVRPYIRKNIVEGQYANQEHYLDVQFRLMREDFVSPMRDGITLWKKHREKGAFVELSEELDLLILRDVRVEGAQMRRSSGEVFRYICFQPFGTDASSTQRLKYGQLVVLSSDEFENEALIATIVERDVDFTNGRLGLCFLDDREVSRTKTYTLAESNAYYEMYQHVLECWKQFDDNNRIPFGRYLLKAETDVAIPAYFFHQEEQISKSITIFGNKYDVERLKYTLDGEKVPGSLDDAQRNALCHALTHELAVIQGPPGTGKTFLGRLIVRILIQNMELWNPARVNPILVVCYTNHALDQFLEGILTDLAEEQHFTDSFPSVVRIGMRCKSEILQNYMKAQVVQTFENLLPKIIKAKSNRILGKRAQLLDKIRTYALILAVRKKELLSFRHLQKALLPEHVSQFKQMQVTDGRTYVEDEALAKWLITSDFTRKNSTESNSDLEETGTVCEEDTQMSTMWSMDDTLSKELGKIESAECPKDETASFKKILEQLREADPDINDYYHIGEWDLNKDPNATPLKPVTIFSRKSNQHKKIIEYDKKLHAGVERVKKDILQSSPLTETEVLAIKNIRTLHRHRRWALYMYWIDRLKAVISVALDDLISKYKSHNVEAKKDFEAKDELILRKALVIGATTTGAAKVKSLLSRLGCPVVIVEEAAEVLEAHVLASITNGCQHAILIGDHQQLRPNPSVFALAREYKLEISLFERLIKNDFPYAALEKQHRMASIIADTLMPEFYPLMCNADNVFKYPDVGGCKSNLYFISHQHPEDVISSTSRKNSFEGDYVVNLAAYFVQQGYTYEQITLLCTYTAQASYIKSKAMHKFSYESHPLVETVDNYQGEENDIIILSLVRSTPSDTIGFLAVPNRVCVALSRAKYGFYIIGNMDLLKSKSSLWGRLYTSLEDAGCIGDAFPAFCAKHSVTQLIYNASEFLTKTPNGGCYKPCGFERPCGHICNLRCHRTDSEHTSMCMQKCSKKCEKFGHPCTKLCGEACGSCEVFETKLFPCGHTSAIVCNLFNKAVCRHKCERKLPCGHVCGQKCSDSCACLQIVQVVLDCGHSADVLCAKANERISCNSKVEKVFDACGHRKTVTCSEFDKAQCNAQCERILSCGHRCQSVCGKCLSVGCAECTLICGKQLSCGHKCPRNCKEPCEPCTAVYINQCDHILDKQKFCKETCEEQKGTCNDTCVVCVERCNNSCKHRTCDLQCWQACQIPRCNYLCDKNLICGHPCNSICGETCPDSCISCNTCNVIEVPVLQFKGCMCIVPVKDADSHILKQTLMKHPYTCPMCSKKLPVNSCFRYAKELKEEVILYERTNFAKLLNGDVLVDSQRDLLQQIENDLMKIKTEKGKKLKVSTQIADTLDQILTKLRAEFYNNVGVRKWQAVLNLLSDLCQLTSSITTKKFNSISKKRFPHLYALLNSSVQSANSIMPILENDLHVLSNCAMLLKTESPSVVEIPLGYGLRQLCVKFMIGCLSNDLMNRSKDLSFEQFYNLQQSTLMALCWTNNAEQKIAFIHFLNSYCSIYKDFDMHHMLINNLRCMDLNFHS